MAQQYAVDIVAKVAGNSVVDKLNRLLKGTAASAVEAGKGVDQLTGKLTKSGQQIRKAANGLEYFIDKAGRARKVNGQFVTTAEAAAAGITGLGTASRNAANGVDKLNKAFGVITAVVTTVGSAVAAFNTSISRTESERKIQILGEAYGEAGALAKFASESADTFGQSQTEVNNALAKAYARLRPVGVGLEDIVSTYNGFQTAARLSGASAGESAAAFTQLAQALGSGRLAGDEFRSIAEQAPLVLQAISKETGIAVGQLKQFAADGNLTADVVIKALKRIETEGAGDLAETLKGPAQAFANLRNAAEDLFADLGKLGEDVLVEAVNAITSGIKTIRDNLDLLVPFFTNTFSLITNIALGFGEGFTQVTGTIKDFGATTRQVLAVVAVVLGDLAKVVRSVFTFIGTIVGNIVKFVGSALNAVVGNVVETGQSIVQNVSTTVRSVAKLISDLVNAISGLGGTLLEKVFGINLGDVVTGPLNALANGIDGVAASVGNYITSVKERAAELNFGGGILPEGIDGLAGSTLASPDPDGGGKGGKKGRSGKSDAERELERQFELQQKLKQNANELLAKAQERLRVIQGITDFEKIQAEGASAVNDVKRQYADLLKQAQEITDAVVRSEIEQTLKAAEVVEIRNEELEVQKKIKELQENATASIDEEIAQLQAIVAGREEEYKRLKEIKKLEDSMRNAGLDPSGAAAKVDQRDALKKQAEEVKELNDLYSDIASGIAGEFTSAFKSIIDGSKDVQTAVADMAAGIADRMLDMAMKILQDVLMQQLLNLLKSLGSGPSPTDIFSTPFKTFEGGGYTGDEPRTGGIDGKGGFPAILHPQETVVDHYGDAANSMVSGGTSKAFADNDDALEAASAAFAQSASAMTQATETRSANTAAAAEISALQTAETYFASGKSTVSFDTYRVGEMDVVTREDAIKIGQQSAKQAEANVYKGLRNMPAVRGRSGVK